MIFLERIKGMFNLANIILAQSNSGTNDGPSIGIWILIGVVGLIVLFMLLLVVKFARL